MSNPIPPAAPTGDNSLDPVFSSMRSLLIVVGTILAGHGYGQSKLYQLIEVSSGAIMVVGPAAWGVWNAIQNYRSKRTIRTEAVNATLQMAAQGQVLVRSDGMALPATDKAAEQIVSTFKPLAVDAANKEAPVTGTLAGAT